MNPATQPAVKRRRIWPWILVLGLTPFFILGLVAASFLTLDRDASVLRRRVMAATHSDWRPMVQLSIGRFSLAALRAGVVFVPKVDERARLGLRAVNSASVGVYQLKGREGILSRAELFSEADQAMAQRGFMRLVGVCDHKDTVLIYAPLDLTDEKSVNLCLAVVSGRELVVVSTEVNASILAELVSRCSPGEMKNNLHLAGL
jgi:hypothetical protein